MLTVHLIMLSYKQNPNISVAVLAFGYMAFTSVLLVISDSATQVEPHVIKVKF